MPANKVIFGSETIIDLSEDTATANDVLSTKTFHDRSGAQQQGNLLLPDELSDLTGDVDISNPQDKQVLMYDALNNKWTNVNVNVSNADGWTDPITLNVGDTSATFNNLNPNDAYSVYASVADGADNIIIKNTVPSNNGTSITLTFNAITSAQAGGANGTKCSICLKNESVANTIITQEERILTTAITAGTIIRIPETGTSSAIKATSTIIPVADNGTNNPVKYTSITTNIGYVELVLSNNLSIGDTIGIVILNN